MEEVVESKRVIETRLGRPVAHLSYPVGGYSPFTITAAREAGYQAACTTNRAHTRWPIDRFALRRIKVTERDNNPLWFLAKVSGYYDCFRRLKQPS